MGFNNKCLKLHLPMILMLFNIKKRYVYNFKESINEFAYNADKNVVFSLLNPFWVVDFLGGFIYI